MASRPSALSRWARAQGTISPRGARTRSSRNKRSGTRPTPALPQIAVQILLPIIPFRAIARRIEPARHSARQHRLGKGAGERVGIVGRGEPPALHVLLLLEPHRLIRIEAIFGPDEI